MPENGPPSHQWSHRYKTNAVVLGLLAALAIGGPLYAEHLEYVGGTKNSCGDGFLAFLAVCPLIAFVGLVYAISVIFQIPRSPRTPRHLLLRIAFLMAAPLVIVAGFMISTPTSPAFLRGFERWVLREVDIDAIQQWLATEGRNYVGKQHSLEELPDFLVSFKPDRIRFRDSASKGSPCVEFGWGGGLAHWGLVVGLPDMPTPTEDPPDLGPSEVEIRRPVRPGVYAFEQG